MNAIEGKVLPYTFDQSISCKYESVFLYNSSKTLAIRMLPPLPIPGPCNGIVALVIL